MGNDNLKRILDEVRGRFPFDNYANETSTHIYLAGLVQGKLRLKQGMRITDIGAGPCDKTALLSKMGYQCEA